jgi:hypothetical protein
LSVTLGVIVLAIAATGALAQEESAGPEVVFFGVLRADGTVVDPNGVDESGRPVYDRPFGSGFSLVVEAKRGASAKVVGEATFSEPGCPDLQVQVTRPLGDGSPAVCDSVPPDDGGVPAIDPPDLDDDPAACNALNDLGCRFVDGAGHPQGRQCSEGCVLFPSADLGCVSPGAITQFCALIAKSAEFAIGETLVTARVRDVEGNLGPPAQIIVRIATPTATRTPTVTPTFTPLPTATHRRHGNDDGCGIVPSAHTEAGPTLALLVLPALLLRLGARRRARALLEERGKQGHGCRE